MLQIVRHLTLIILLLKIRLNSSSSILRMRGLTPQVTSMHTTGGNITSFATLTGSFLTGYVTYAFYKESSCTNLYSAGTYILNSCYRYNATTYYLFIATSSSVVETSHTDSQCTKVVTTVSYPYTDGVCDASDSTKTYVSSSSVWNSDSATVTVR